MHRRVISPIREDKVETALPLDGSRCSILRQFLKGTSVKAEPPHWEGRKVSHPAHSGADQKVRFLAKMRKLGPILGWCTF